MRVAVGPKQKPRSMAEALGKENPAAGPAAGPGENLKGQPPKLIDTGTQPFDGRLPSWRRFTYSAAEILGLESVYKRPFGQIYHTKKMGRCQL